MKAVVGIVSVAVVISDADNPQEWSIQGLLLQSRAKRASRMFMLTEIRRHAKSGLFLLHCPQALVLAPESCVKLNGW
jgi:hypothetical protein